MGQQGTLGLYNFFGFWGFGVIVGYVLCFHEGWGLQGLWSGIVAGVFLTRYAHEHRLQRRDAALHGASTHVSQELVTVWWSSSAVS